MPHPNNKEHKAKHKRLKAAIQEALVELSVFGADARPEVTAVDEERVDVAVNGKLYHVPYVEKDGGFTFGRAEEATAVEPEPFSAAKESESIDLTVAEDEAHKASPETGDWPVVIIEEGCNTKKRRRYTSRALKEADVSKYANAPMHIDHAGQEGQYVARSLRDKMAVVKDAWHAVSEGGKQQIRAMVHVFPGWFRTVFEDGPFRKSIGLSHVADIAGRVEGTGRQAMQVVESIVQPYAVDFVSKAAFGGRVTESDDPLSKRNEDLVMLETLTVPDLERERPDLVESIETRAKDTFKAKALESEAVDDATQKATDAENRAKAAEAETRKLKIERLTEKEVAKPDSKIPEHMREVVTRRATERLGGIDAKDDAELTAKVTEVVKAEAEFGAGFGKPPEVVVPAGTGAESNGDDRTDLEKMADETVGVKENKD